MILDHLGLSFLDILVMFDFSFIKATCIINFSLVGRSEYGEKKFSPTRVSMVTDLLANQFSPSYEGN